MPILSFVVGVAAGWLALLWLIEFGRKCYDNGYSKWRKESAIHIAEVNMTVHRESEDTE